MNSCTFERFSKDIASHQLTMVSDDGLFRHLKISKPNSSHMHFNITTWPGYLCISGDMGCYVFQRIEDMFDFFRGEPTEINPGYWDEKVQAGASHSSKTTKQFSAEQYDKRLDECLAYILQDLDPEDEDDADKIEAATEQVNDFKTNRENSEWDCVSRIHNWDPEAAGGLDLDQFDFFEGITEEFTFHYIWCCYAIVHAIAMYDKAKAAEVMA